MDNLSLMSREEVFPSPETVEPFAEYTARVVKAADDFAKQALAADLDPRLAARRITSLKVTFTKDCFDATGGQIATIDIYELGPSSRSVRGIECVFPVGEEGLQKTARYEWDFFEPSTSSRQSVITSYTDIGTGDIHNRSLHHGFEESDLTTIELGIQGYTGDSDAKA